MNVIHASLCLTIKQELVGSYYLGMKHASRKAYLLLVSGGCGYLFLLAVYAFDQIRVRLWFEKESYETSERLHPAFCYLHFKEWNRIILTT